MPGNLLALVELFGYKGDRKFGVELKDFWNMRASHCMLIALGDDAFSKLLRQIQKVSDVRSDMPLLIFHLVLSAFIFEGVDVCKVVRVLQYNLRRYLNGARLLPVRRKLSRAHPLQILKNSRLLRTRCTSSDAVQEFTPIFVMGECGWPVWGFGDGFLFFWVLVNVLWWTFYGQGGVQGDTGQVVAESRSWWGKLGAEATWSKATHTYGEAVCLATLGEHAETKKLGASKS
ncbi:hypothetical protein DEU56DRAFT_756149 [Suillus clintonianus]|uniref:uncharacterized protein n=1 Tax=Suillus clintonianus TaxID=1904413 RepID=UPI001B8626C1|nr:uncharacterized protein DEU56DRAFT_756149 [Suillus clintonianus]KAG2137018.1 hypothetical protein DEU56DRAFT_756149 [Suillus clintonianus]